MIAFQSSKYNGLSLTEEINFTLKNNLKHFDIFFDRFIPNDLTLAEFLFIQRIAKKINFSIHAPIVNYKTFNDTLNDVIVFCNKIKPYSLTIHFNYLTNQTISEILKKLNSYTKLSIENTIPNLNQIYSIDYEQFIEEYLNNKNIYLTFDIGHYFITNNNPNCFIQKYINKISTIHIHNNDGIHDTHSVLNNGKIKYISLLKKLKQLNYSGLFIIEHWNDNLVSANIIKQIIGET